MITEKTTIRMMGALNTMAASAVERDELDDGATLSAAAHVVRSLWTEVVELRARLEPKSEPPPSEASKAEVTP